MNKKGAYSLVGAFGLLGNVFFYSTGTYGSDTLSSGGHLLSFARLGDVIWSERQSLNSTSEERGVLMLLPLSTVFQKHLSIV